MQPVDLAILAATEQEIAPLSRMFAASGEMQIAGNPFTFHRCGGLFILAGVTGVGKVNAAAVSAAVLTRFGPVEVWNTGCAGAYRESGLQVGDVVVTGEWLCGDEGVLCKGSPTPEGSLGIALLTRKGRPLFDRFLPDDFEHRRVAPHPVPEGGYVIDLSRGAAVAAGPDTAAEDRFRVVCGPSLTVGMSSGDPETASRRFRRYGALAENMEGSAVAQACLLFDAPFLEIRGISNMAGIRDKSAWDIGGAVDHCLAVVARLLGRGLAPAGRLGVLP